MEIPVTQIIFINNFIKKRSKNELLNMFSDNYYHNNMLQRISKWQFLITFFYYKNKILKNVKKKIIIMYKKHKYKCLWDVGGKSQSSNLQKKASHTYTLRLG